MAVGYFSNPYATCYRKFSEVGMERRSCPRLVLGFFNFSEVLVPAGFRTAGFSPALWTGMHFEVGKAMYRYIAVLKRRSCLIFA